MSEKHVHIHEVRQRGTSAHTKEELEQDMNAGALKDGTNHIQNLKGSTAGIVAPEELSGTNYDETFLQGIDVKTYEQATRYITAKIRPLSEFSILRSNNLGKRAAKSALPGQRPTDVFVHPTSSLTSLSVRSLKLDEPEFFDDTTSPASVAGSGNRFQMDTSVHKRTTRLYNKFYMEERDLGQPQLFQDGTPYKDTSTSNPVEIVGSEAGNQIEFPEYMVHATDRVLMDGVIEPFIIRRAAERSALEHPYYAQGIKSDLQLLDAYRKSIVVESQYDDLKNRKLMIGRTVRTYTTVQCNVSEMVAGDALSFVIGGVTCTVTIISNGLTPSDTDVTGNTGTAEITLPSEATANANNKAFANSLVQVLREFQALDVKVTSTSVAATVFIREILDRKRTKGVVLSATHDSSTVSNITDNTVVGGFTIEYANYSASVYESAKTRALAGYDYYLDGVESFGIEVLDNAERIKLLTSSIENPESEDPEDRIKIDAYEPWLAVGRSGTFGEDHIGPINTQGFIAPESGFIPFFEDTSDKDEITKVLVDSNTFSAKPNFFLTDERTTLSNRKYNSHNNLLLQAVWNLETKPFVTSSHSNYNPEINLALTGTNASGSVAFVKESPYFKESKHYGFRSSQGREIQYPSVLTISGSHHLSGRSAPDFKDDSAWTVSYWMSGSDERADHFSSTRDIIHFTDSDDADSLFDTADLYPNVSNFKVRHFVNDRYGFLYVSLFDNDFYPSNHHRVDFIFGAVKSGSNFSWLRNSKQENSLYNALSSGKKWNHFAVTYDGSMTASEASVVGNGGTYKSGDGTNGIPDQIRDNNTYENFLKALEEEETSDGSLYFQNPAVNQSSRKTLYNYGVSTQQPYVITGSTGEEGHLACPVRLHLNGVDITDNCLEYITHNAVRTTGHNVRYGSDYLQAGVPQLDYRNINFTGTAFTLSDANNYVADNTKAYAGHTVSESVIVLGGDPNAVAFNSSLQKKTSTDDFATSTETHVRRRVHANQNTNTIAEFAMWNSELPEEQIRSVWELSRFNDVLYTVEKPMAAAITRMNASFEDGVDKGKRHATKGFVFGNSEHGTDSIVYGGLKK